MSNATKSARAVFDTFPLSSLVQPLSAGGEVSPGLSSVPLNASDEMWQAYVLSTLGPTMHAVGTVAMLPRELGGAVDSNLKVYGTANVRVVGQSRARFFRREVTKSN